MRYLFFILLFFVSLSNSASAQSISDLRPGQGIGKWTTLFNGQPYFLQLSERAVYGKPLAVVLDVNIGTYSGNNNISTLFEIDMNGDGKPETQGVTAFKFSAGAYIQTSGLYTIPPLPLGTSKIRSCIDRDEKGAGVVIESDESNNCTPWYSIEITCDSGMIPNGAGGCQFYQKLIPTETKSLLGSFRDLYAPSVITYGGKKKMFTGGWLTDSDPTEYLRLRSAGQDLTQIYGADKIFYSEENSGVWSFPVLAFQKKGYHANDPSVIAPPSSTGVDRSKWLYMYYTALDNRKAADATAQVQNNSVGFATSVDGGKSWTDGGIKIAVNEGGDGFGAWAPSAVLSPARNEIWVYYHTGTKDFSQAIVFRQRFQIDGVNKIGAPTRITTGTGISKALSNVDVANVSQGYVMAANMDSGRSIVRLLSTDGLNWTTDPESQPLIIGGVSSSEARTITPHLEIMSDDTFRVYFGYGASGASSDSIQMWQFTLPRITSALTASTCVPGLGQSTVNPNNALICDAKVSWSSTGVTNAYVVIKGSSPYSTSSFPNGFVLSQNTTGTNQKFWVTNGTYTATLFANGLPPTNTTPGVGKVLQVASFTVGKGVAATSVFSDSLSQLSSAIQSIQAIIYSLLR